MIYSITFSIYDVDTSKIRYSEKEIYEGKQTPEKFVKSFFENPPFTSNLVISAKILGNYCDVTLESRGLKDSTFEVLFQREKDILKNQITQKLQTNEKIQVDFPPDDEKTLISITFYPYTVQPSKEEFDDILQSSYKISSQYREIVHAEIGASAEYELLKALIDPLKYIGECIALFLVFKNLYDKRKRKNHFEQGDEALDFDKDYKIIQIDKHKVAISKEIDVPVDKIEIQIKEIRLDGLFMSVSTEKGYYSIEFNNANQIVVLRKL